MITIFTPTYNRAYTLPKLYHSLQEQTCKDFEWLIVDDGSTDGTCNIIKDWQDCDFEIRFYRQENSGKHIAINKGVKEARGELFFIVDSDDYLTADAIEWIHAEYEKIKNNLSFAGLSGIRISPDGKKIGGDGDFGCIDTDSLSIRFQNKVKGDLAEVFKTDVLRRFPFPCFEGEKFCPEAIVWNKIAQQYKLRFIHKGIYVCEYRPDGLTAKITKLRYKNPQASIAYYSELYHYDIPFLQKVKASINFWRFFVHSDKLVPRAYGMLNAYSIIGLPFGFFLRLSDILNKKK